MSVEQIGLNDEESYNSDGEDGQQQIEYISMKRNLSIQEEILKQQPSNNFKTQYTANLEDGTQCRFIGTQIQNLQFSNIQNCNTQILKRLPVILPSSQFVLKPAQTVLKPTRNVRILPNTNKILNSTVNAINAVHSINGSSQNSILIPKAKLLNGIPPQMLKAAPLTTQILNSSNISAQLLGTSQIVANSSEITNHVINTSKICTSVMNATPVSTQTILNPQICLSSVLRPAQQSAQRQNTQHFITPVIRNNAPVTTQSLKSTNILSNGTTKNVISGQILKPVQIPPQILRTVTASMMKNSSTLKPILKNTVSNSTTFRAVSTQKSSAQDSKSVSTSTASVLRFTQLGSTPISILKPQSKTTVISSQNLSINSQNTIVNSSNGMQNSCVQQCTSSNIQNEFNGIKTMQNNVNVIKLRQNVPTANGSVPTVAKKMKHGVTQKVSNVVTEKNDSPKPLGSSENPIQIIQQGHQIHRYLMG